ncbi:MAG: hypothetical protein ACYDBP_04245 [Leptospirales bacterium]
MGLNILSGLIIAGTLMTYVVVSQLSAHMPGWMRIRHAAQDVRDASYLQSAANSYFVKTNDPAPTIAKMISAGIIPAAANGINPSGGGGVGSMTTPDGTVIVLPGTPLGNGTYGMTMSMAPDTAKASQYVVNHMAGSVLSGSTVSWTVPIPALANLAGQFVQTNPSSGSIQYIGNGGNLHVTGGVQSDQGIATNEIAPVNGSGSIEMHQGVLNNVGGLSVTGAYTGQTPPQYWGCAGGGCYGQWQSNQLCLAPFFAQTVRGGRINGTWTFANNISNGGGNNYGYVLVPCNAGPNGGW